MYAPDIKKPKCVTDQQRKVVLTKALLQLARAINLNRKDLSAIIGLSESTLSRIFNEGSKLIDPTSKEGQLALILIRIYRNLDAIFGGNGKQVQDWLQSENYHLHGRPIEIMHSIQGLVSVVTYLDAIRGKN